MLKDLMQWRYATKKYDPSKTVEADKLEAILNAITMAPTSSGSQPFEVLVVSNEDARKSIPTMGMNQELLAECSHVLVFASWDNYTAERIDAVRDLSAEVRGPSEMLSQYYESLKAMYLALPEQMNAEHTARQAYIAFGFAMLAAAEQQIDATPIEGFDPAEVDTALGLAEKGLKSRIILTLGYRDAAQDWLVNMPKVRKSRDAMFTFIE